MQTIETTTGRCEPRALFVGCLDPSTTESDLVAYFSRFDPKVTVKLITETLTRRSKQCAIVTISSQEICENVVAMDHTLMGRLLRVEYADEDRKGKKVGTTYFIQVSGIEITTELEEVIETFSLFPGLVRGRFIEGLHPQQKRVAVLSFDNYESFSRILTNSHYKVGERNCKVVEYDLKQRRAPQPSADQNNLKQEFGLSTQPDSNSNIASGLSRSLFNHAPLAKGSFLSNNSAMGFPGGSRSYGPKLMSKSTPFHNESQMQGGSNKLIHSTTFVHPVEVDEDGLFKIFCQSPSDKGVGSDHTVPKLSLQSGVYRPGGSHDREFQ